MRQRQIEPAPKPSKTSKIGAIVPAFVKGEIERWSDEEGRSERSHVAILLRKLVALRQTRPEELQRLGLMDGLAAN